MNKQLQYNGYLGSFNNIHKYKQLIDYFLFTIFENWTSLNLFMLNTNIIIV